MKRALVVVLVLVVGLALLAAGLVVVAPGEVVVVRRFGRLLKTPWPPGLHWSWPLGIDRLDRVRTDEVRRLEVGLAELPSARDDPAAGEFLTGDRNLLRVRAVVQYRVINPVAFVLSAQNREALLERSAEAALARACSRRPIDAALRLDRVAVARDAEANLAALLDRQRLGLAVLGLNLTDTRPPLEVEPDFAAAQAAASERDRRVHEARGQAAGTLAAARAAAQARRNQAHAEAERAILLADARAQRFTRLLAAVQQDRALTIRRIYLDALRDLVPRIRHTVVLSTDEPIDLSVLGLPRAEPDSGASSRAPRADR